MKKSIWKRAVALLMLVSVALSLCSCAYLDDLKELHAVWADEGRTEIRFQGKLFRALPVSDQNAVPILIPSTDKYNDYRYGNLTDPDVPVLLSDAFGTLFHFNAEYTVLQPTNNYASFTLFGKERFFPENNPPYYVEESVYDRYVAAQKGALDHFVYFYNASYENKESKYGISYFSREKAVPADEALCEAIRNALASPGLSDAIYNTEAVHGYFTPSDADALVIREHESYYLAEIMMNGKKVGAIFDNNDSAHLLDDAAFQKLLAETADEFDDKYYYYDDYKEEPAEPEGFAAA